MREQIRDLGRLEHILEAIRNALEFGKDATPESLTVDKMRYFAIVKNIEIIGEAAYMLSLDYKRNHPDTEWNTIIRMRHVLVHGYYQVSSDEILSVITKDLQPLYAQIVKYIEEYIQQESTSSCARTTTEGMR